MAGITLTEGDDTYNWYLVSNGSTEPIAIVALGGNDTIVGGAGDDFLYGGAGDDSVTGLYGNDYLSGGDGNDTLVGNFLQNSYGADILDGGGGADTFLGDALDIASYQSSNVGLTVDLLFPGLNTGDAAGDVYITGFYTGILNLQGSIFNDALFGTDGADYLDGGTGTNTASYIYAPTGVTVDLLFAGLNTGEAAGDTFVNIQNIEG